MSIDVRYSYTIFAYIYIYICICCTDKCCICYCRARAIHQYQLVPLRTLRKLDGFWTWQGFTGLYDKVRLLPELLVSSPAWQYFIFCKSPILTNFFEIMSIGMSHFSHTLVIYCDISLMNLIVVCVFIYRYICSRLFRYRRIRLL